MNPAPGVGFRDVRREEGPALSAINRACPIVADFTILFDRGEDFFAWPDALYDRHHYVGVEASGALVGYCMVGEFRGWVGDGYGDCGYAGDARVLAPYRGQQVTKRALRALEPKVGPDTRIGFGLVKHGNRPAEWIARTATAERWTGDRLADLEVVNLPLLWAFSGPGACRVRRARVDDADDLAALLRRANAGRLLAPDLPAGTLSRTLGGPRATYVAERAGRLVGTITGWDLAPMHFTRVLRYSPVGQAIRAAYRLAAAVLPGATALPAPGEPLRTLTLTDVGIEGQDPGTFRDLLAALFRDHLGRGYHLVHAGGVSQDPLLRGLAGLPRQRFVSTLFRIDRQGRKAPEAGLPYVDLARI